MTVYSMEGIIDAIDETLDTVTADGIEGMTDESWVEFLFALKELALAVEATQTANRNRAMRPTSVRNS